MKKVLSNFHNAGLIIFVIGFVWSLVVRYGNMLTSYSEWANYLIYIGVFMAIPLMIYKLCHFKEYKNENINFLVLIAILVILILYTMLS